MKITTLVQLLRWRADKSPHHVAYRFLDQDGAEQGSMTCAELDTRARAIAAALHRTDVKPGDRVLLLYPSGLDYVAGFFGCLYAGTIAVPAFSPGPGKNSVRLAGMAKDAEPRMALTVERVAPKLKKYLSATYELPYLCTEQYKESDVAGWQEPTLDGEDVALLQYTSGSTSNPRGVMVTHSNLLYNQGLIQEAFRQTEESCIVSWLPLYHDMGLIGGMIQPLYVGAPCVLMSPETFLQRPARWLRAITKYKATTSGGPNFAYELCVQKIKESERAELDLSTWTNAFNGSERVRAGTLERFANTFAGCEFDRRAFHPCYGLAEATLLVSGGQDAVAPRVLNLSAEDLQRNRATITPDGTGSAIVSCGRSFGDQTIKIVNPESLQCLTDGEIGEICVAGSSVTAGYWNQPEESQKIFCNRFDETDEARFLRTGDLGFMHDRQLYVTGRLKEIMIMRGRNYYPEDIEETIRTSHSELSANAAFSIDITGEERLVVIQEYEGRRQGMDAESVFSAMGAAAAEQHQIQIYAAALVKLGTIPRTTSGKIQRRKCRALYLEEAINWLAFKQWSDLEAPYVEPETPTETKLAGIVEQVLGRDGVGAEDDFFSLGGDSLLGTQFLSRLNNAFQVEITLPMLFKARTVRSLALSIEQEQSSQLRPMVPALIARTQSGSAPLSFSQQRLWFMDQLYSDNGAYIVGAAVRLNGELDVTALQQALETIVQRHDVLRARFPLVDDKPVQIVEASSTVPWHNIDLSGWPEDERETEAQKVISQENARPIVLRIESPIRATLVKLNPAEHIFLLSVHHIVFDGWSGDVLLRELAILYEAFVKGLPPALPALPVQYSDFACWQREWLQGEVLETQLEYWREQLRGAPVLELPTDHPRPAVLNYDGAQQLFSLSPNMTAQLRELSRREDVTLFMVLVAVWQILMLRYTGQADVVVGTTIANRKRIEVEGLIGFFVNTLMLRTNLGGDPTFRELLERVRDTALGAYAHQEIPFDQLVAELQPDRSLSRTPLFQVLIGFREARNRQIELPKLRAEVVDVPSSTSIFDLSLFLVDKGDRIDGSFEYSTNLFDASYIERMREHLLILLQSAVTNPDQPISALAALPEWEHQLLARWNTTSAEYSLDTCLHKLFETQARKTPDRIAVRYEGTALTYKQLNAQANRCAHHLRSLDVKTESRVGVYAERSLEMVVALIAILKAGAMYVPLDPSYPQDRLAYMIEDSSVSALLIQEHLKAQVPEYSGHTISLSADWRHAAGGCEEDPAVSVSPANAAYMIYTSGSTGRPKGVVNIHSGICNRLLWIQSRFPLDKEDRVLQKTPFGFDVSVWEFFWPLINGATLIMSRPEGHRDPGYLTELIEKEGITTIHFVPSMLSEFLNEPALSRCKGLRQVLCSGEALPANLVERFFKVLPDVKLYNLYGPTEASVEVTYWDCQGHKQGMPIPIGRPIANTELHILDAAGAQVPVGIPGELHIGGAGVARGYWNRPRLTAERFVPDSFSKGTGSRLYRTGDRARFRLNGEIEYLGRLDHQVKLRGFRIELGEIESALASHPGIYEAAVLLRTDNPDHPRLVAYIVERAECPPEIRELKSFLARLLPESMVPFAFVALANLPKNSNGKLDRDRLPMPQDSGAVPADIRIEPATEAERVLAEIWREVLGVEHIGIHDNFFNLGGDSILSIQVASRANRSGIKLTPRDVFERQTIAQLAAPHHTTEVAVEAAPAAGPVPLTPIQHWFFEHDFENCEHWNQAVLLEKKQPWRYEMLREAFDGLLAHHDGLRLRFYREGAGWRQEYASLEEVLATEYVEYFDASTLSEAERPHSINKRIAELHLSLDLSRGPLFRAAFFDAGPGNPSYLFLVAHHLIIDAVSWRILIDDLKLAYEQRERGEQVHLSTKTISYAQWSTLLRQHVQQGSQDEMDYWSNREPLCNPLPLDREAGPNDVASVQEISVSLGAEETKQLLVESSTRYKATMEECLVAALIGALARWSGHSRFDIDLERHGREEIVPGVDCSRTVGWFTSIFPIQIKARPSLDAADLLRLAKEQLRAAAKTGLAYGALRYLSGDEKTVATLKGVPSGQVSFNYLGKVDQLVSGEGALSLVSIASGATRSPRGHRPHLLEVMVRVQDGCMHAVWAFSKNLHHKATAEKLAGDFLEILRSLLLEKAAARAYIPSDFSLPALTTQSLQGIVQSSSTDGNLANIYPALPAQQGMIFHSSYTPMSGIYIMQVVCDVAGKFNVETFQHAWQKTIKRHEALRTSFFWTEAGEAVQVVHSEVTPDWHQADWSATSAAEQMNRLDSYLEKDRREGFELGKPPLIRLALFRTGEKQYKFVWTYHHVVLDGWSTALVLKEVVECYESLEAGHSIVQKCLRPYGDYIEYLRQQHAAASEKFWRRELIGFTRPTRLSIDKSESGTSTQAGCFEVHNLQLEENLSFSLQELARENQLTLYTVLQGAWALLLGYYSESEDIVFGTVSSGRPASLDGVEGMAGLFVNSLPVRAVLPSTEPLLPWLCELQGRQVEMRQFESTPLIQIQAWSEIESGMPVFDTIFSLNNYPVDKALLQREEGGLDIRVARVVDWNSYPLSVAVTPGRKILVEVKHDSRRFERRAITEALDLYHALLRAIPNQTSFVLEDFRALLMQTARKHQVENAAAYRSAVQKKFHELKPRSGSSQSLAPQ
ncbi:MAG: amino acid adenylation domain-containing protein [Candidatus Angelobacter sp.]